MWISVELSPEPPAVPISASAGGKRKLQIADSIIGYIINGAIYCILSHIHQSIGGHACAHALDEAREAERPASQVSTADDVEQPCCYVKPE